jgi:hypothetical protein
MGTTAWDRSVINKRNDPARSSGNTSRRVIALRRAAEIAVVAGAAGSIGFLLRTIGRNPSLLLVILLALWVVSPFVALLLADVVSKRGSMVTRATLFIVMLVVALGSLGIYSADALWPRSAQAAFFFIVVPPTSWLLIATVLLTAMFVSRLRSRLADRV